MYVRTSTLIFQTYKFLFSNTTPCLPFGSVLYVGSCVLYFSFFLFVLLPCCVYCLIVKCHVFRSHSTPVQPSCFTVHIFSSLPLSPSALNNYDQKFTFRLHLCFNHGLAPLTFVLHCVKRKSNQERKTEHHVQAYVTYATKWLWVFSCKLHVYLQLLTSLASLIALPLMQWSSSGCHCNKFAGTSRKLGEDKRTLPSYFWKYLKIV